MYSPLVDIDGNQTWTLDELSKIKAADLVPAIAYLCFLMIIGVIGNACVLVIFYFRFSESTHRTFILVLAFYDFFACVVGAPWAVAESFFAYSYMDEISCKIFRFILYYTCIASSLTLVLIAFERYRKICTPLKKQFTVPMAKRALFIVTIVISSLSASPAFVFYGNASKDTGVEGITGTRCFITDFYEHEVPGWPMAFNVYLLILAFVSTLCMTVCYAMIARQVSKMGKANISKRMKAAEKSNGEMNSVCVDDDSETTQFKAKRVVSEVISVKSTASEMDNSKSLGKTKPKGTLKNRTSVWANKVMRKLSTSSGKKTVRITKMLTLVTIAFVISYLPHLSLMIWSMVITKDDKHTLPTDNEYKILFYSFFINNLVNPFIYASMDLKFRGELAKLFKCKFSCKR
ncbi:growth hormone secretagogue receptor type 1-like [Mercenaria mercenaria]|uniref:growth hormone secretagogue receptor type 1-like n=1 Tax=Mercenaria mercenaria TaxID=6596 RepID=UPI00234E4887|nr:growth hormone secretagogue receptor type 1-like [Mercenaria mercenaria]